MTASAISATFERDINVVSNGARGEQRVQKVLDTLVFW